MVDLSDKDNAKIHNKISLKKRTIQMEQEKKIIKDVIVYNFNKMKNDLNLQIERVYCVPGKFAEESSTLCYILGVLINFRNKK